MPGFGLAEIVSSDVHSGQRFRLVKHREWRQINGFLVTEAIAATDSLCRIEF
jgi:hypothetical protein